MIKEIALDPMAAPEPRTMGQLLRRSLGPYCGKYLSDFPADRWWQDYVERFPNADSQLLNELRIRWNNASHNFQRTFEKADDWCTNVHREDSLRPFAGVAATTPNSFDYPSPDDDRFDDVLQAGSVGGPFDSTPREFADICKVLIARGPEVVINDPYLSKLDERQDHSNILLALLEATIQSRTTDFLIITQLRPRERDADAVLREFDALIANSPRECRVRVALIHENQPTSFSFHQRFLVTRHGGFIFDQGFSRPRPKHQNKALVVSPDGHIDLVDKFINRRDKWAREIFPRDGKWPLPKREVFPIKQLRTQKT